MTKEKLDKLIEQERWETFDSINPGYHGDLLKALTELKNLQESCEDCISREAVLAMSDYIGETPTYDDPLGKVEEVVRAEDIRELPSVTLARKKGKWTEYPHEWGDNWQYSEYECSVCHNRANFDTDYCPNCGAEMEVGE